MEHRPDAATLRAFAVLGGGLAVGSSTAMVMRGYGAAWTSALLASMSLFALLFAVLVWIVGPRQPRNRVVWILGISTLLIGVHLAGAAVVMVLSGDRSAWVTMGELIRARPADLPPAAAWTLFFTEPLVVPGLFGPLTLGLLLFPDGDFPSARWRWVGSVAVAPIVVSTITIAWTRRPWGAEGGPWGAALGDVAITTSIVVAALSAVALVVRLRRSSGDARQQLKWVAWGGSLFSLVLLTGGILVDTHYQRLLAEPAFQVAWTLGSAIFVGSYGIALVRYRLYDIDQVISRTVLYVSLAVSITGLYVMVVGLGSSIIADPASSPMLSIAAITLVAFAFEPIRERLQRLANRVVYGRRASPYEVLSAFASRITTDEERLRDVARALVDGTTAAGAAVWVVDQNGFSRVARWPSDEDGPTRVTAASVTDAPEADLVAPVVHDGELLGAVTLSVGHGHSLLPSDDDLLARLAPALGLTLRNIRLREQLRWQVAAVHRSRRRIVSLQDQTRRRLERNLHDGAQQRLVAIKVKLGLVRAAAKSAGSSGLVLLLDRLARDTDEAVDALRDLARGIYPPLLEAEGLGAALAAQVHKLPIPVTVHAAGVGRRPSEVEAGVYFCVLEALQNVVEHAVASSAHVALRDGGGVLCFEVSDDGRGFDPGVVRHRAGLTRLADRLDALDGHLRLESSPLTGTRVRGEVPVRSAPTEAVP